MDKVFAAFRYFKTFSLRRGISSHKMAYVGRNVIVKIRNLGEIRFLGQFRLDSQVEIISSGEIEIGDHFVINKYSRIIAHKSIKIGSYVTIARFVSILDHDHAFKKESGEYLRMHGYINSPITIGNNVWIADKVSINKGVTIGDNVIIGANSVVTKDIPSNCVAAGIPCKVLKSIF